MFVEGAWIPACPGMTIEGGVRLGIHKIPLHTSTA